MENTAVENTPDMYVPSIDDQGNYVDNIPVIRHGIYCQCGARKNWSYANAAKFTIHTKSLHHQKWLTTMNQNKMNHYAEMLKLKDLVGSQQKILARLENELLIKSRLVTSLETQINSLQIALILNDVDLD